MRVIFPLNQIQIQRMKNLLTTIVFIFGFFFSQAQHKITYGLAAGVNISSASYGSPYTYFGKSSKTGFAGNAFVNINFAHGFSLQGELGYINFGSSYHDQDEPEPGDYINVHVSRNYITLAVLPTYKFNHTGLSVFAGPSIGYLINTRSQSDYFLFGENYAYSLPPFNYQKVPVFGILGAAYSLPAGFGISARYINGLTNIMDPYQHFTAYQHSFNFMVNYTFR